MRCRIYLNGLVAGTAMFLTLQQLAMAQTAALGASESDNQGEIVVTATRRTEALNRVPVSVVALTPEKMDAQGIRSIDDIARLTPGLNFSRTSGVTSGGSSTISIRGIASNVGASTTGIYIDDTPIQSRAIGNTAGSAYPKVFDLQRVEVLRGPQGTLFGAGAQGGAVRFITPEPSLTKTQIYTRSEVSVTQAGGANYEAGVAVGTPLIQDKLGIRLAAWYRHDSGYIDRVDPITGATTGTNINSTDSIVVSGALKYQATDNLTITPSVFFQQEDTASRTQYWESLSDPSDRKFDTGALVPEPIKDRFVLPALKVEADLGFATLVSNSSYFHRANSLAYDYTRFNLALFTGSPYSTLTQTAGYHVDMARNKNAQRTYTQEVRLQSNASGPFHWTIGLLSTAEQKSAIRRRKTRPSCYMPGGVA